MLRLPFTSRALFRLTILAAVVVGQWVLPWAHVEFDHGHNHAAAPHADGSRDVARVAAPQSSDTHPADCSVCDWIRTAQHGLSEPMAVAGAAAAQGIDLCVDSHILSLFEYGVSNPRAPPFVG